MHLAITGLMDSPPDMVFSGINHGPNMGDDTLYSGTVAATEGYLLGIPSVAMSLAGKARRTLCQRLPGGRATGAPLAKRRHGRRGAVLLNVNRARCHPSNWGPWQVTRLGRRHHAEPVVAKSQSAW